MKKRVLVTGSSRGIGKEIAIQLFQNGYEVVVHGNKNIEAANAVANSIESYALQFDVGDFMRCEKVLTEDIKVNGGYYGVVLSAGITRDNVFPLLEKSEWDEVVNTNLGGFYNVLKPLVMPMIESRTKGRIITISSIAGLSGNRGQVNYSASKAGLIGATKSLALELAKRGITVNSVAPGLIDTDMVKDLPLDEIRKHIPMKRIGSTKEVASLVKYLISEDASYITGQVISVNGGLYL